MNNKVNSNVLVIVVDQLRANCVFGGLAEHVNMPNIRALAEESVWFDSHYSVLNPCGPSRASLLTAKYGMNHRSLCNGTPLAHDTPNIAREVRKIGYEPLLFGYTDTSPDPRHSHPNDPHLTSYERPMPGFREALEMRMGQDSFPWRVHLRQRGYDIDDYRSIYLPVSPDPTRAARLDDPVAYSAEDSDTAFLTDQVIHNLQMRREQKWVSLVTYVRPHPPIAAPAPYNTMYRGSDLPQPITHPNRETEARQHPYIAASMAHTSASDFAEVDIPINTETDIQTLRGVYLGLVSELDHHIGRLINALRESGQLDNTLVVITSDHGEMLGDHHMWGKTHVYDSAWRIPLLVRDPNQRENRGSRVTEFTESIDITPTVIDWLGATPPDSMDGSSLLPLLGGTTPPSWRDYAYSELDLRHIAAAAGGMDSSQHLSPTMERQAGLCILREKAMKLVYFNGGYPPLLFDTASDPHEMNNLANNPDYIPETMRLIRRLLDHRMSYADHTLSNCVLTETGANHWNP